MKYIISLFILTTVIIIIASGCSTDSVISVKQETKDNEIASALNKAFSETFQKIQDTRDNTESDINDTISSPVSGNAVVTGWVTEDQQTGVLSWDLNFDFIDYKVSKSAETYITFNGLTTYAGYSNNYTCTYTIKSDDISAKGTVGAIEINFSCSCNLESTLNKSTGKGTISGTVCGRTVYYNF